MQKTPSAKVRAEYDELAAYLRYFLVLRKGALPRDYDRNAADIVEKYGWSKALIGLRQAVNDTIGDLAGVDKEVIGLLDRSLSEAGIVSFSELRRRYSARYGSLLKRGLIRSDTEFYMASGIASDLSSEIPDEERLKLQGMLEAYERDA